MLTNGFVTHGTNTTNSIQKKTKSVLLVITRTDQEMRQRTWTFLRRHLHQLLQSGPWKLPNSVK